MDPPVEPEDDILAGNLVDDGAKIAYCYWYGR